MITLREPREDELPSLSALCLRSKAHWGYDDAFMAACVDELTLHPDALTTTHLQLAEDGQGYIGITQVSPKPGGLELGLMYVDPNRIGTGAGRLLFDWAKEKARSLGASSMDIVADPNAKTIYEHMGAYLVGEWPSESIPGRMLPLLKLDLS